MYNVLHSQKIPVTCNDYLLVAAGSWVVQSGSIGEKTGHYASLDGFRIVWSEQRIYTLKITTVLPWKYVVARFHDFCMHDDSPSHETILTLNLCNTFFNCSLMFTAWHKPTEFLFTNLISYKSELNVIYTFVVQKVLVAPLRTFIILEGKKRERRWLKTLLSTITKLQGLLTLMKAL